jgi:diguanylate cyclase (GGDEF)-like protein
MSMTSLRSLPASVHGWFGRRLGRRIVGLFLALLLAVQGFSLFATRATIGQNAQADVVRELEMGEKVLHRLLAQSGRQLADGARLLAADYGFRSAVQSGDVATIASALDNHGARIGASMAMLLDTHLQVRAATEGDTQTLLPAAQRLAGSAEGPLEAATSEIVELHGRALQVVMVPMRAPLVIGWVVMAFPIDATLVREVRDIAGLEVRLLTRGRGEGAWHLAAGLQDETAGAVHGDPLQRGGVGKITIDGRDYRERRVRLSAKQPASVEAVLMRSVEEAAAPYRPLQLALMLLTLLSVGVFAIGSVLTAQHVTTPVRELVGAADRLGRGDLDTPVGVHSNDEIGELAQAFDRMRVNLEANKREVTRLAYWDTLTGLPNRAQFRAALHLRAHGDVDAREADAPWSVLLIGIDRFKHVNDVLGYAMGDLLLKQVGQRLVQAAGEDACVIARLDGDQFALLLPDANAGQAFTIAVRLSVAFERSIVLDDQAIDVGISIGVASLPQHAQDVDALMVRAEAAMAAAKRGTRGVSVYEPAIDAASAQTLSLLGELRRAVERGELRLYLQPKVALADSSVIGAEALVRWQHPERGLVPPMEFIPFAEQTGFIRTLTAWVAAESLAVCRRLHGQGVPVRVSVNLSTRDLMDQDLPAKFLRLLEEHRMSARAMCLEITESAIMDDPKRALQTLERLNEMGFKLSIDDFGTGYSSLAYLKRLPVDELKIDKSFVMQMARDGDDAKIVRSTIDLAHNMGLSVVAEGVETATCWRTLRSLGCDEAQGYLISKPLPADQFVAWCERWREREGVALHNSPDTTF